MGKPEKVIADLAALAGTEFAEEWAKRPLGLTPRWLIARSRLVEVEAAMGRYREAGLDVPLEWIEERFDLYDVLYKARF